MPDDDNTDQEAFLEEAMEDSEGMGDSLTNEIVNPEEVGTVVKEYGREPTTAIFASLGRFLGAKNTYVSLEDRIEQEETYQEIAEEAGWDTPEIIDEYESKHVADADAPGNLLGAAGSKLVEKLDERLGQYVGREPASGEVRDEPLGYVMEYSMEDGENMFTRLQEADRNEARDLGSMVGEYLREVHDQDAALYDARLTNFLVPDKGDPVALDGEYSTADARFLEQYTDIMTALSSARQAADSGIYDDFVDGLEDEYGRSVAPEQFASMGLTHVHAYGIEGDEDRKQYAKENISSELPDKAGSVHYAALTALEKGVGEAKTGYQQLEAKVDDIGGALDDLGARLNEYVTRD